MHVYANILVRMYTGPLAHVCGRIFTNIFVYTNILMRIYTGPRTHVCGSYVYIHIYILIY
jgi:hypothetical protein